MQTIAVLRQLQDGAGGEPEAIAESFRYDDSADLINDNFHGNMLPVDSQSDSRARLPPRATHRPEALVLKQWPTSLGGKMKTLKHVREGMRVADDTGTPIGSVHDLKMGMRRLRRRKVR